MAELTDSERERLLNEFGAKNSVLNQVPDQTHSSSKEQTRKEVQTALVPPRGKEAVIRGAKSGALMGFQPQAAGALAAVNPFDKQSYSQARDEAQMLNDAAYQADPLSYGAGYAGGALGTTALTGGLGALAGGARGAAAALPIIEGTGISRALSSLGKAAKTGFDSLKPTANLPGKVIQGTTSTIGSRVNEPYPTDIVPPPPNRANDASTTTSRGFSSLQQWLADAKEDDKRKRAMELQASSEGRAISNDS